MIWPSCFCALPGEKNSNLPALVGGKLGLRYTSFLILFILGLDFVSKYLTHTHLPLMQHSSPFYPYGGIPVFRNFLGIEFSIVYATNKGAAWGSFAEYGDILLLLRIALIVLLLFFFFRGKASARFQIPLALIIAGAIGNVIDYFVYGHVVDMFHFILWGYDYPVFNVADVAICIGVFLYLILSWIPSYDSSTRSSS